MKILILLSRNPVPARDGGAIGLLGAVRELHAAGNHVDVFVLNTSRHRQDPGVLAPFCDHVTSADIDTSVTAIGALRNLVSPRRSGAGGWSMRHRSVPLSYWIERFVHDTAMHMFGRLLRERGPYDIVLCETLFTAPYGFEALRLMAEGEVGRCPVVLRAHNIEHRIQERMSKERTRSIPERIYRAMLANRTRTFEREVFSCFDGVTTTTEDDAAEVRRMHPGVNVCVAPPGVEMPGANLTQAPTDPHGMCLLGSLEWAPNVQGAVWFLQDVLPRIRAAVPDAVVHVGGRGEDARISAMHDGTSVIVHGEVADALAFRAASMVSVVPLFSGSGIRVKIQEAMALARVVVSTTVGIEGIPAVHGEHCYIADDAQGFADACITAMQDHAAARRMGAAARTFVEDRYSWDRYVQTMQPWLASLRERRH